MNKYKKLATDTCLFVISNFASKLLIFLLLPLYTNLLNTDEYAVADLITTTINLIFPILTLSIAEATLRFAFDKNVKRNEVLSIAIVFLIISTMLVIVSKSFIGGISETIKIYWWDFCICYFVTALQNILSYYARGCDKTKVFAISGIVHSVVLVSCNILFLVVFKLGLDGYLLSMIISYVASSSFILFGAGFYKELILFKINKSLMREMLKYSIPMIPTIIAWWVMQTSDKYMIIWKLGLNQSGIYSVAYKIPTILTVVSSLFTQAWQISAISNYKEKDNSDFVGNVYGFFNMISVLACAMLILLSKILGRVLFAKDYFIAWKCVPILLIAYVFSGLSGFLASNFTSAKKTNILFVSTSIGAIVNAVLNLFLIVRVGIIGAAYTTFIGFFVTWFIRLVVSQKLIKIEISYVKHILMYFILFIDAVYMYNECYGYYIMAWVTIIVLLILNKKEIKKVGSIFVDMLKRKVKKCKED